MPKFYCTSEDCSMYEVQIDVDSSICAYNKKEWEEKTHCSICKEELTMLVRDFKPLNPIGKFSIASMSEKMSILKARAHDTRIPSNKRDMERKKFLDENYTGTKID